MTYPQQLLVELVRGEGGGGVRGRSGTRRQPQRDELVDLRRRVAWVEEVQAIVVVAIAVVRMMVVWEVTLIVPLVLLEADQIKATVSQRRRRRRRRRQG